MFHGPGPGRPKGSVNKSNQELKQLILDRTENGAKLIDKLWEWLDSESDALRTHAMTKLLEYGFGKAKETIEHSGSIEIGLGQMFDKMVEKKREPIKLVS